MEIKLENMEFFAHHGCLESERRDGNRFRVDFKYTYDSGAAELSDNLEDAIDYSKIYELIAVEMSKPSNLLENVARRTLESIRGHFPQIGSASITISKYNPPVGGPTEISSVTLSC